jgi:hypothetical protein
MEWMNGNELYAIGMNVNSVKLNVCLQMWMELRFNVDGNDNGAMNVDGNDNGAMNVVEMFYANREWKWWNTKCWLMFKWL